MTMHRRTRESDAKLFSLRYEFVSHPSYFPDFSPSDYDLFPNLNRWLQEKRFSSNDEVIHETEAYFAELNESHYHKDITMLEDRWTNCIAIGGFYVEE